MNSLFYKFNMGSDEDVPSKELSVMKKLATLF